MQNKSEEQTALLECKKVVVEYQGKIVVRWAHPDGYFLSKRGQKTSSKFSPRMQAAEMGGSIYPKDSCDINAHILMALAFYGPRPTYIDLKTGKEYVGIVHHLIPDKLDYRPANLLCYLTREQHKEADRRQRVLKKILPDMHALTYFRHRTIQDPRVTSREAFDAELQRISTILDGMRETATADARPDLLPENRPMEELRQILCRFITVSYEEAIARGRWEDER